MTLDHSARSLASAAVVGVACGIAARVFLLLLDAATAFRVSHEAIVFALPLAGLVVGVGYERGSAALRGGTNLVLAATRAGGPEVPAMMAPLVLVGTVVTHLFGGSAGREGTAVQMGASLADSIARAVRASAPMRNALVHAGIAGGFGAVFGTPIAGVVFALEAPGHRRPHLDALGSAAVGAFVGDRVAHVLGVAHAPYPHVAPGPWSLATFGRLAALSVAFAMASALFIEGLHWAKGVAARALPRLPIRMAAGGVAVVVAWRLAGDSAYLGLSVPLALRAFDDPSLPTLTFAAKAIFTVLTLAAGFVGGEVTPLFVVGATLGNVLARAVGLPVDLGAGVGLAALFGSAAKAPVALAIMAGELLGWGILPHALAVALLASMLVGRRSVYPANIA
jgi:H+/Cl- antiporter ClcA